jgi:DNA-binding beta-propeller fold protein YncE
MAGVRTCLVVSLVAAVSLSCGCASSWRIRSSQPTYTLQWPFSPNPAKLTFVRSIFGFSKLPSAGSALSVLVYGVGRSGSDGFALPVAVATSKGHRIAVADMGRACVHLFLPAESRYLRLTGTREETMRTPVAVVFDDQERLFVSDSSGRVFAFGPDGSARFTIHTAAGQPLLRPTGIAFSPRLRVLYVLDTLAHSVYAFDEKGTMAFAFGGHGDGEGRFNFPTHITRSPAGEILIVDSLNFRVQILDEKGKYLGSFGHHGDGSGDMAMPKGVAVDGDGVIYVADSLFDIVQLFDRSGGFLLTLGRRGEDFGEFWMPSGIFIDGDMLYVCDTYNHRVQVFQISERYSDAVR